MKMNNTTSTDVYFSEDVKNSILTLIIIISIIITFYCIKSCCNCMRGCCILTILCCDYGYEICNNCDKTASKRIIIETSNILFGTVISPTIINKIDMNI